MATVAPQFTLPPSVQSVVDMINSILGIAAGGEPSWIATGIIVIIVAVVVWFAKSYYDKWVQQSNQQAQDNDEAGGVANNQNDSNAAGNAANQVNQDGAANNDSGKQPVP